MSQPLVRQLNKWHGYAMMIGGMIGAGLFVVTGEAGGQAGPSVPFGYLVLLPIILCTAVGYLVFLSTPLGDEPGGAYTHISRTFNNPLIGFIFMWFQYIALIGVISIMGISFGQFIAPLFPGISPVALASVIVLLFYALNVVEVRWFGRIQLWMTAILLIAIAVLVIPGLFSMNLGYYKPLFPFGLDGFIRILPSLFFSYFGFEQLAQAGGEMKNSRSSMPKTMLIGLFVTAIIYFSVSFVAFGHLPYQTLAKSHHAMADVSAQYLPGIGKWVVTLGIVMAFATTLNSVLMVASRMLYSFSKDRALPEIFARVNSRFGTPHLALTVNTVLVLLLLWTHTLQFILNISLQGMFIMYIGHAFALLALPFVRPQLYESARVKPPKWLVVLCGVVSITVLVSFSYHLILSVWPLLTVWLAAGLALYFLNYWAHAGERSKVRLIGDRE